MVRGTGKFKQKRGGGRNFSRHLELNEEGTAVSVDRRNKVDEDGDSDEDEEEEEEEESSEEEAPAATAAGTSTDAKKPELTREERRAQKKQAKAKNADAEEGSGDDEDPLVANNNRGGVKAMKLSEVGTTPSRREREAKEKKDAQERYWKLHEQGKTDQAKADMARLAKIRADREAAAAKRKAETEAKAAEVDAKKKAQMSGRRQ